MGQPSLGASGCFFSPQKEPHYFCTDFPNYRWAKTEGDYLAFFKGAGDARVISEASVRYLYSREAARQINAFNNQAKILILLRKQGSFLPSYHKQVFYNRDEINSDFAEVWRISKQGLPRTIPASCRESTFLDYNAVGDFETQVGRYIDVFSPQQLRVVWMEDWREDLERLYRYLQDFLDLRHHPQECFAPANTAHHHRSRMVSYVTNNPPQWVLRISGAVKQLLGVKRLHIAERLRRMNRGEGYSATIQQDLKAQIEDQYLESNERLRARINELGIGF
jgi:hypothetical protein